MTDVIVKVPVAFDVNRMADALRRLAGEQVTVFLWDDTEEPTGDVWVGSKLFAERLLREYEQLECMNHDPNTGPGSDWCPNCRRYEGKVAR